jgi:hypothetical protein
VLPTFVIDEDSTMRTLSRLTPLLLASSLILLGPTEAVFAQARAVPRPSDQGYRDQGYRAPRDRYPSGPWGGYRSIAFDNGFDDGYREGLRDSRSRDRYDPVGNKRYRKGDQGYDRRYGPRDYYKREYRDGFRAGYERGYREGRYSGRSDRRGGWYPWR